ncbi:hypothetical protein HPB50_006059 [Hyalomma asiaticum]|uniref:Uncharacterized protein n=1 Tax=Hyalomma asiaticum TaxID=266040 RepID=A0ACB7SC58_HYAAI|nr:hypothetical protein HPB50_006059 [Hyalomma asiaticum]
MDNLRPHQGVVRESTIRLLSEATEILLQGTQPSFAGLQEIVDGLRNKGSILAKLDRQITDRLDGSVLTDRYGRKDLFIDDHIDSLLALEPIESLTQVSTLRDLYEQIRFRINCLDSLRVPSAEYTDAPIARGPGDPVP